MIPNKIFVQKDQINIEGKDCLKNIYGGKKDLDEITCNWKKFCKLDELNKKLD